MPPKQIKQKYPVVFFHGNGQTGTVWKQTPDGRPGWAYYLINQGYVVYMVDYPARGRSRPYVPDMDGKLSLRTALELEQIWTGPVPSGGEFPRKKLKTQWPSDSPKKGMMGDPVFDNFRSRARCSSCPHQAELAVPAGVALLDPSNWKSPVILITHSQGGGIRLQSSRISVPILWAAWLRSSPAVCKSASWIRAKVKYTGKIGNAWGITNMPMHYDPPVNSPDDLKTYLEEKIGTAG